MLKFIPKGSLVLFYLIMTHLSVAAWIEYKMYMIPVEPEELGKLLFLKYFLLGLATFMLLFMTIIDRMWYLAQMANIRQLKLSYYQSLVSFFNEVVSCYIPQDLNHVVKIDDEGPEDINLVIKIGDDEDMVTLDNKLIRNNIKEAVKEAYDRYQLLKDGNYHE